MTNTKTIADLTTKRIAMAKTKLTKFFVTVDRAALTFTAYSVIKRFDSRLDLARFAQILVFAETASEAQRKAKVAYSRDPSITFAELPRTSTL